MGNKKNALEEFLKDFLDRNLKLKFDICTCDICRKRMLEYILLKFPYLMLDPDDPHFEETGLTASKKYLKEIFTETNNAINFVHSSVNHPPDSDKEAAFDVLINRIKEVRGLDFGQYHKNVLKRRVALRLAAKMVGSYTEYLVVLERDPEEYDRLFDVMTINVSDFFRDPDVWFDIGKHFKNLIEVNNAANEPITIWSAGCAYGEEPYSLAILSKVLGGIKVPFKIYATDLDRAALTRAAEGAYSEDKFNKAIKNSGSIIQVDLHEYFESRNGRYYLKDEIKSLVEFKQLDFVNSEYLKNVDMIFCRNVFIYFTKPLQERILDGFYQSLKSGGYLIIGQTETLVPEARVIFKEISRDNKIFQKVKV